METPFNTPLRPTQHAKHHLIISILNGTHPPGSNLPSERILAQQLGVTRPTLRETLQRLASEKWITIQHGKPTRVNDYWHEGGLSMLGTLAMYNEYLPNGFITHLLELRATLLPTFASLAARRSPKDLGQILESIDMHIGDAHAFADFDWHLQILMARLSGNPIYLLILNDFASIFKTMALQYFSHERACQTSLLYYHELRDAIGKGNDVVERVVRTAMEQSIVLWKEIDPKLPLRGNPNQPGVRNGSLERVG